MILVLTVHFTTNIAQLTYTIDLQKKKKKKKQKEACKGKIDIDHVKTAASDKVTAFMNETLLSAAKEGFDLHELENIHLNYLSEYNIFIESHITRFGENLIERTPKYEVLKHDEK